MVKVALEKSRSTLLLLPDFPTFSPRLITFSLIFFHKTRAAPITQVKEKNRTSLNALFCKVLISILCQLKLWIQGV
jgi:hypothetical protein